MARFISGKSRFIAIIKHRISSLRASSNLGVSRRDVELATWSSRSDCPCKIPGQTNSGSWESLSSDISAFTKQKTSLRQTAVWASDLQLRGARSQRSIVLGRPKVREAAREFGTQLKLINFVTQILRMKISHWISSQKWKIPVPAQVFPQNPWSFEFWRLSQTSHGLEQWSSNLVPGLFW